jgi:hypothetical protein
MSFRRFLVVFWLALVLPGATFAQSVREDVEAALVAQGYQIVTVGRTLLGRLRVVAQNETIRREIVINPTTGEVLRDYSMSLARFGQPLFPNADRNPYLARDTTRTGGGNMAAAEEPEGSGADGGDVVMGAEGAVGAPPLVVNE